MINIVKANTYKGIHITAQDQLITLHNFNIINTKNIGMHNASHILATINSSDIKMAIYVINIFHPYIFLLVGCAGFEPATSSSQATRDNQATLTPYNGQGY